MTRTRWIIVGFWIFVGVMLIREFVNYDHKVDVYVAANPEKHYFYDPKPAAPPGQAPVTIKDGPDVRQIAFSVSIATPYPGQFTTHSTLKNFGNVKAVGVQVYILPFKNLDAGDDETTHYRGKNPTAKDIPVAGVGQWAEAPDLAPGETVTVDKMFIDQHGYTPGANPDPQITFLPEKKP